MPKGSRVLMADDDRMLIDMYKERLELAGYQVIICRNGEEALAKVKSEKPDIVMLDVMMPKANGYETLAAIKSDPTTKDIPVIMLSALMRDFNREKAIESGADDYLIKSESMPSDVITKIEQVLTKYAKPGTSAAPAQQAAPVVSAPVTPSQPIAPMAPPAPMPPTANNPQASAGGDFPRVFAAKPLENAPAPAPAPTPAPTPPAPDTTQVAQSPVFGGGSMMEAQAAPEVGITPPEKIIFEPETQEARPQPNPIFNAASPEENTSPIETTPIGIKNETTPETAAPSKEDVPVVTIPKVQPQTPPVNQAGFDASTSTQDKDLPVKKTENHGNGMQLLVTLLIILLAILANNLVIYFFFLKK